MKKFKYSCYIIYQIFISETTYTFQVVILKLTYINDPNMET